MNQLKETKLSPSDKAEKIIRDIETVIRRNEANSAAYVEFQNRLDELIKKKQEESDSIEQLLLKLSHLYGELDDIATLPQKMGFEDKGTFEIFTHLKNARNTDFHEELTREFAKNVVDSVIRKKIYIGWQDVASEISRLRVNIEIFAAADKYQQLAIDDDAQLMDAIMMSVVKNFGLR